MTRAEIQSDALAAARFGFWAALGTGLTTSLTWGVAIFTPPLSGSACQKDCFTYPYEDIAGRFPRDYYWMFLAILATLFYVAFVLSLHSRSTERMRLVSQLGVALALMAGLLNVGNYFTQLAVVQPSLLAGETQGIALLTQYNPNGLFIALEELGYLLLSASLSCLAPGMPRRSGLERWTARLFVAGAVANVLGFCAILFAYGHARGYRFEILVISVDWLVLIAGSLLMARAIGRESRDGAAHRSVTSSVSTSTT